MFIRGDRKGQVTVFVIIALVIVVIAALAVFFYNDLEALTTDVTPQGFLEGCMNSYIDEASSLILSQGGVLNPKNFINYGGVKVEYLCYTSEYYKTCVMQKPLLKDYIEREFSTALKSSASACINDLRSEMQSQGYSVNGAGRVELLTNITLNRMDFIIATPLSFTKGDSVQNFDRFVISKSSRVYDLVLSAMYILNWEARYGDFDILTFMLSYPDLKLQKYKQSEGSKIYILTSRSTGEEFVFASRSISWPPGYPQQ